MKTLSLLALLIVASCELEGVQNSGSNDSDSLGNRLIDSTLITIEEVDPLILPDSVNGAPNDMVWQAESGLRVEWTKKENNPIEVNDVVMVNYHARVAGGDEYDNNDKIGKPVPLKSNIGMMVPGWETGLLEMNIGDEGRIMIPNALGYGENGYSSIVPPEADLIVDIEIVEKIKPIILDEGVKVYIWQNTTVEGKPTKGQKITFDYFAYTVGEEGKMYDNSYQNGEPFTMIFENDNVVEGLHQGMSVLSAGDNAFIEIPTSLAYGKAGLQDLVPRNTNIVYDVRVISIE
ncbi:MAG: FKBP-type peptidyl-prolyl cis-trans isomerase [Crocinitomicaceae bacterium]|nr:FKBP-type peptidyl-prolyl cis-trans isomerase [Crocinitomicaceae bacterium]